MAKLFLFLLVTIFVFIQCNVANNKVISGNYAESVYEPSLFEGTTVNNKNEQPKTKAKKAVYNIKNKI
ncbi:unnamed protein product [Meloidogyne enterolobii]|uniref:Uncharacterized protein n=1 Tax=Meloidogyne enterolobii TaxID=390850 RepID=A0ACB0ZU37_MELEN